MALTWFRDFSKGVGYTALGVVITVGSAGLAAPVGAALAGSGIYSIGKSTVRGLREISDEEDGEVFFVYYDFSNFGLALVSSLLPDHLDTDIVAGGTNTKLSHCKAWFSTGSNSFTTFEITTNASWGVLREKSMGSKGSLRL